MGKVNELLIKSDLLDLTEGKEEEEDVVEESDSKADRVFRAASLETALNLVMTSFKSPKAETVSAAGDARGWMRGTFMSFLNVCLTPRFFCSFTYN